MGLLDKVKNFFYDEEDVEDEYEEEVVDTVGGVILKFLGRIAQMDDSVFWKNLTLQVKGIDGVRITKVLIVRHIPVAVEQGEKQEN